MTEKQRPTTTPPPTPAAKLLADFDHNDPLTFFVGWPSGQAYHLRRINLDSNIADEFRRVAFDTIHGPTQCTGTQSFARGILHRTSEPWSAEAEITPETYLECDISSVGEYPRLVRHPHSDRFLEVLSNPEDLDTICARDVTARRLNIYGFSIGRTGNQTTFIRRANPQRGLGAGKLYGIFSDALQSVKDPILAFDENIDLITTGDRLIVLSQNAFIMLFRGQEALKALVPKWGDTLASHFPFSHETKQLVIDRASRDSRSRRRLEAIVTRGHLRGIEPERIKDAMESCSLNPDLYFTPQGELCAPPDEISTLLHFLNEDLYQGQISNEPFRVDRKAIRT